MLIIKSKKSWTGGATEDRKVREEVGVMMPEKDNDAQGGRRSCGWREDCDARDMTVVSDPRCIAGAGLADEGSRAELRFDLGDRDGGRKVLGSRLP